MRERLIEPTLRARSLLLTPRLVVRESCGAYSITPFIALFSERPPATVRRLNDCSDGH